MRIAVLGLSAIPAEVLPHDGVHHHPHGIDLGWIVACAVGICGGDALGLVKRRRK